MSNRAAIYVRVSSDHQADDGTSLDTQLAACRQYSATNGYDVVAEFSEVFTGVNLWDRRELTALREAIRSKEIDVVIAYAIDRLSRDPVHLGVVLTEAEHHGVSVVFVSEPLDDSPEGQLIRFVRGYAAKVEHEKFRERAIRGRMKRVEQGMPLANGRPRYGFQWADERKSRLIEDPAAAQVMRSIFDKLAAGWSLRRVALWLHEQEIPTPTGNGSHWRHTTIRQMVMDPLYIGKGFALRWKTEKGPNGKKRDVRRPPDEQIPLPPDYAPALVDEATFYAVQERLRQNKERSIRNAKEPEAVLLRGGYAVCGHCGANLRAHKRRDLDRYRYVCMNATRDPWHRCTYHAIFADEIDQAVWSRVEAVLNNPGIIRRELERLRGSDPVARDLESIERLQRQTERQIKNLAQAIALIDDPTAQAPLVSELRTLQERIRTLETEHQDVRAKRVEWEEAIASLENIEQWCDSIAIRIERMTWAEKRLALDALGVKARVYRAEHDPRFEIEMRIPVDTTTNT